MWNILSRFSPFMILGIVFSACSTARPVRDPTVPIDFWDESLEKKEDVDPLDFKKIHGLGDLTLTVESEASVSASSSASSNDEVELEAYLDNKSKVEEKAVLFYAFDGAHTPGLSQELLPSPFGIHFLTGDRFRYFGPLHPPAEPSNPFAVRIPAGGRVVFRSRMPLRYFSYSPIPGESPDVMIEWQFVYLAKGEAKTLKGRIPFRFPAVSAH